MPRMGPARRGCGPRPRPVRRRRHALSSRLMRRAAKLPILVTSHPVRSATCLLAALVLAVAACGGRDEEPLPEQEIRIASGLAGGVYREYAGAFRDVINEHVPRLRASVLTTQGSVENLQRLEAGTAKLAFSLADTARPAIRGRGPFARRLRIVALARLYDDYVQVIARSGSGLERVTDLDSSRTVSIGARRSGTALTARAILRHLRLDGPRGPMVRSLPLQESADALLAGEIDAFFWSGGLPTDTIKDLSGMMRLRLLALPVGTGAALDPSGNLYDETSIPSYVYETGIPVPTITAANLLVVRVDMPEETAFRLTRALFEHKRELETRHPEARRLNLRDARSTYPLNLHPGALRWYREANR